MRVLGVVGSLHKSSISRIVITEAGEQMKAQGCEVDILDFALEPLPLFNVESAFSGPGYTALRERVDKADVFLLGTPDYHGSMSSAMKNFLEHFWHEFAGKLFVIMVASHEKGLTVIDQLRTVARQCYAWVLPYGVSFAEKVDVRDGKVVSDYLKNRLAMTSRDAAVYGRLLADQRRVDLAAEDLCFLAKYRGKNR